MISLMSLNTSSERGIISSFSNTQDLLDSLYDSRVFFRVKEFFEFIPYGAFGPPAEGPDSRDPRGPVRVPQKRHKVALNIFKRRQRGYRRTPYLVVL